MRLFEMEHLPASVGGINIVWADGKIGRTRDAIHLPLADTADFWPLLGGRQFLCQIFYRPENVRLWEEGGYEHTPRFMYDTKVFFGGVDATPFLVELEDIIIHKLKRGSGPLEDQLFRLLKPNEVLEHESATGKAVPRQGDWFAIPFCAHKNDIALCHVCGAYNLRIIETDPCGDCVGSTPHRLHGWTTAGNGGERPKGGGGTDGWGHTVPPLVGEGVLTREGHPDLVLATPHLLLRSRWIERTFHAKD